MKLFIVVAVALLVTACGSSGRFAVLRNPQTQQTVDCRTDHQGLITRGMRIDACVSAYKKAGYQVVGEEN